MVLSFFVYIGLLIIVLAFTFLTKHYNQSSSGLNWTMYIPIFLCTLVFGLRYDVGVDWMSYKDSYEYYRIDPDFYNYEFLYNKMCKLYSGYNLHYAWLFMSTVFIQMIFLYKVFEDKRELLFWGIFFFFVTGQVLAHLNIIRHGIAFMIFLYSVKFIRERKFLKYLFWIFIATLFHRVSLLLIPLYFLGLRKKIFLDNIYVQFILYFIAVIFSDLLLNYCLPYLGENINLISDFYTAQQLQDMQMTLGSGYGALLRKCADFIIILLFYSLRKVSSVENFSVYFRIYLIGMLLTYVFSLNMLLVRAVFCLDSLRFIVLAFIFHGIWSKRSDVLSFRQAVSVLLLFIYIALYLTAIFSVANKISPYQFISVF